MKAQQQAIGIAITWGQEMIKEKGGLLPFIRFFESQMKHEDNTWLQKCKNKPLQDINLVYIVVCNQVRYKMYYGGYETGARTIYTGDGYSWSSSMVIHWPRIILAGPFEKAPRKIYRQGTQGFRYIYEPIF